VSHMGVDLATTD